jgi:hypothetical protein
VIAVIGCPVYRRPQDGRLDAVVGTPALVAEAAAAAGARVELVGRIGDDRAGDAVLLALARSGVGHAAMLRDPARPTRIAVGRPDDDGEPLVPLGGPGAAEMAGSRAATPSDADDGADPAPSLEPGDVELGLRYVREYRVVVVAEALGDVLAREAADAASFADAALVAVVAASGGVPAAFAGATVLAAPDADPDGAFAALVGRYAAALDAGLDPSVAFAEARVAAGWEPSAP